MSRSAYLLPGRNVVAILMCSRSIHFPKDRELWQNAAHLEARAMVGEGDDLSDANRVLGLINRDPIQRLHFLGLARYQAGYRNQGIENALKEHFASTSAGDDDCDCDSDDGLEAIIQFPDEDDTPKPAAISGLELKEVDPHSLKLWPEVYNLLVVPPSSAEKFTPTLGSFVEALETDMEAEGKGMAEFG